MLISNYSTNFAHFKRANVHSSWQIKTLEAISTSEISDQLFQQKYYPLNFTTLYRGRRRSITSNDNYTFNRSFVGIQFRLDEMQVMLVNLIAFGSCVLLASFHPPMSACVGAYIHDSCIIRVPIRHERNWNTRAPPFLDRSAILVRLC